MILELRSTSTSPHISELTCIYRVQLKFVVPWALAGAAVKTFHYYFYDLMWRKHSLCSGLLDSVTGHAIMGAILGAIVHPKFWFFPGAFIGALAGFLFHDIYFGNHFSIKDPKNFSYQLPGLTEEERKRQDYKDEIEHLGFHGPFISGYHRRV